MDYININILENRLFCIYNIIYNSIYYNSIYIYIYIYIYIFKPILVL